MDILEANIKSVKNQCADFGNISIVAATKTQPPSTINRLLDFGITMIGENRVAELLEKYPLLDKRLSVHFIGQLQTNKVKKIIDKVSMIHSLDRLSLCVEIERLAAKIQKVMPCLVEVNLSGDQNRGGVAFEDTVEFVRHCAKSFHHIRIEGLMTVMPIQKADYISNSQQRNLYLQMRELYDIIKNEQINGTDIRYLSMGMSGDFREALKNGSNMIRLGSALFMP